MAISNSVMAVSSSAVLKVFPIMRFFLTYIDVKCRAGIQAHDR
jgi:hypothetical protein